MSGVSCGVMMPRGRRQDHMKTNTRPTVPVKVLFIGNSFTARTLSSSWKSSSRN
jgi:hypothetical protein